MNIPFKTGSTNIWYRILSTITNNIAGSVFGFLSSFLIAKYCGLHLNGEYAIFISTISLTGILYILIPPNYAVYKLQDVKEYSEVLITFYCVATILNIIAAVILIHTGLIKANILSTILYILPLGYLSYLDVSSQAFNKIEDYYKLQTTINALKLLPLVPLVFTKAFANLNYLVLAQSISQATVLVVYVASRGQIRKLKSINIYKLYHVIKKDVKNYAPYYISATLKRLEDNIIIVIIGPWMSTAAVGSYNIVMKAVVFVFGLARTIEAFIMSRFNMETHGDQLRSNSHIVSMIVQFLIVAIGITYIALIGYVHYILNIVLLSLCSYTHIPFLIYRAREYSCYRNTNINKSAIVFIASALLTAILGIKLQIQELWLLTCVFLISKVLSDLTLIQMVKGQYAQEAI